MAKVNEQRITLVLSYLTRGDEKATSSGLLTADELNQLREVVESLVANPSVMVEVE